MRVLIIGGSGFLSGTLARVALAIGHSVTIVTRGKRLLPAGVRAVTVDRNDRAGFARFIAEIDVRWDLVVDAICYTPDDATQDVEVFAGRTERLVLVSTDFVYDPNQRKNPQTEQAEAYVQAGYGGLKRQAEAVLEQTSTKVLPWTILRPSHIYGPGSLPGCLPLHGRDPQLVGHILAGRPLRLVGGGSFLQHPVFATDLAETILRTAGNPAVTGRTFNVNGPEVIESRTYYRVFAALLGREVVIEDVAVNDFLASHPDKAPFCCDRVYDLTALRSAGISLPATRLEDGLRRQFETLDG